MKNILVGNAEQREIDGQVAKILKELGYPEPPLSLSEVRELLKLDRSYYSTTDDSSLREVVSRVKVGAKQLLLRPGLLKDVVRKANLSAE